MKKQFTQIIIILAVILSLSIIPDQVERAEAFNPYLLDSSTGKPAPGFTLKDLSGKDVELSSFKGKHVLLNFWATWCGYCRKERAHLNTIHEEYKEKGLVIIAVSTDNSVKKVKKYMEKIPSEFIVLTDPDSAAASVYNIAGLPTSYLIDREGIVKQRFMGYIEWTSIKSKKLIEEFLRN